LDVDSGITAESAPVSCFQGGKFTPAEAGVKAGLCSDEERKGGNVYEIKKAPCVITRAATQGVAIWPVMF